MAHNKDSSSPIPNIVSSFQCRSCKFDDDRHWSCPTEYVASMNPATASAQTAFIDVSCNGWRKKYCEQGAALNTVVT
jgi:hypothetical protein